MHYQFKQIQWLLKLNNFPPREKQMTDEQIDARIAELRAKPLLYTPEREVRELISYYDDDQLFEIRHKLAQHIKTLERKQKHFKEYWRCKDILKWVEEEECSRPMTSDFLNKVFKIK